MRGTTCNNGEPDMSLRVARRRWLRDACGFARRKWGLCFLLLAVCTLRSADAQFPGAPSVRAVAAGVHDLDGGASHSELSYFGIWDVKANRAVVCSSPQPSITLGQLVRAVEGDTGETCGLAWVIRDYQNRFKIPSSLQSVERILPGDLVVLPSYREGVIGPLSGHTGTLGAAWGGQGAPAANSAAGNRVQVAFVGLESRRPMIVALPHSHATIDHVLEQLHQRAALASTVRVIRTDTQGGPVRRDVSPVRLIDGDVLVFDRRQLDEHGLAVARANGAFPDSRPLDLTSDASNQFGSSAGDAWPKTAVTTFDLGPRQTGSGFAGEQGRPALLEPSAESSAAIGRSNRLADDAADLQFGEDGAAVMTAEHYSSTDATDSPPFSKTTGLVPAPVDPLARAARSANEEPLASLNSLSIAIGVLVLAGLCFLISVAWNRVDRTADTLPEASSSGRPRAGNGKTERKTLDQLIGNRVPMIEEQAHLPDRMDYFGPELGRKRMIIDPPHAVAGPHFAVAPEGTRVKRSSRKPVRSSREPVLAAAPAPQQQEDSAPSPTEARLTRAALQIRQLRRRRQSAANEPHEVMPDEIAGNETSGSSQRNPQVVRICNPGEPTEVSGRTVRKSVLSIPPFQMGRTTSRNEAQPLEPQPNETQPGPTKTALAETTSDELDTALPRVGLLERVLIAMEREKRS